MKKKELNKTCEATKTRFKELESGDPSKGISSYRFLICVDNEMGFSSIESPEYETFQECCDEMNKVSYMVGFPVYYHIVEDNTNTLTKVISSGVME